MRAEATHIGFGIFRPSFLGGKHHNGGQLTLEKLKGSVVRVHYGNLQINSENNVLENVCKLRETNRESGMLK